MRISTTRQRDKVDGIVAIVINYGVQSDYEPWTLPWTENEI
jgi:hypothetical protein